MHVLLGIWNQNSNTLLYEKCCSYLSISIFGLCSWPISEQIKDLPSEAGHLRTHFYCDNSLAYKSSIFHHFMKHISCNFWKLISSNFITKTVVLRTSSYFVRKSPRGLKRQSDTITLHDLLSLGLSKAYFFWRLSYDRPNQTPFFLIS